MAATKVRGLKQYTPYTHLLAIPLVNDHSRPQLRSSFARFENEAVGIVPEGSKCVPELLRINIGRLNLP